MSKSKISLLLPTRGRPFLVKRLFKSIIECTADLDRLEIVLCVDEDDIESQAIEDERLDIIKAVVPRMSMGGLNTACLQKSSGDLVMLMNDDLVICTPCWDDGFRSVADRFPDGIFMAYPDDMERANLSTFPLMSRKTCDLISDPYPEAYKALFIDDHVFDIFVRLKKLGQDRMVYMRDIKFDHRHFVDGNARTDITYAHKNRYKDYIAFVSLRYMRQVSARRLIAGIEGGFLPKMPKKVVMEKPPESLRELIRRYPPIFIKDYGLPWRRRLLWLIRFTKYYAAMKGGMDFLKRRTYTLYGS